MAAMENVALTPHLLSERKVGHIFFPGEVTMGGRVAPSGERVTLKNHTLTGMAPIASTAPCYSRALGQGKGQGKGKGKGKAVPAGGDDEDEEVPVADGEVGADGWRRTYRKHPPEKAPPLWKYMAQCYRNQKGEGNFI